jgi:hypothetical protein
MNLPAKNAGKQSMATCQALQKSKGRGIISGEGGMIVWWSFGAGVHVGPHSCGPGDVAVIPAGAEHTAELQRSFLRHPGLAHAAMFVWDSFRLRDKATASVLLSGDQQCLQDARAQSPQWHAAFLFCWALTRKPGRSRRLIIRRS